MTNTTLFRTHPATHLVRRWIRTTDPRRPLTSVWLEAPCTHLREDTDFREERSKSCA